MTEAYWQTERRGSGRTYRMVKAAMKHASELKGTGAIILVWSSAQVRQIEDQLITAGWRRTIKPGGEAVLFYLGGKEQNCNPIKIMAWDIGCSNVMLMQASTNRPFLDRDKRLYAIFVDHFVVECAHRHILDLAHRYDGPLVRNRKS